MSAGPKLTPWPYPRWIAHRGAGKLAPENTLAAFRLGARRGYRMFECDVKLSIDEVPFLLHDATLERTSTGTGGAGEWAWKDLAQLDAGDWHSRDYAGEPLATLGNIVRFCLRNRYALNVEIKPAPGAQTRTGEVVANSLARWWPADIEAPLLTSFDVSALEAAQRAQPQLPRGLLVDDLWDGWLQAARRLQCMAVVANYRLWNESTVAQARQAGLHLLSYTVNDPETAERLLLLGTDAIITDRVDLFAP
jgi:glycerophosphoryl diester phosphodiesterase